MSAEHEPKGGDPHILWPRVADFFSDQEPMDKAWARSCVELLERQADKTIPAFSVENFPYRMTAVVVAYQRFYALALPRSISFPDPCEVHGLFTRWAPFDITEFEHGLTELHRLLFDHHRTLLLGSESGNMTIEARSVRDGMAAGLLRGINLVLDPEDQHDRDILHDLDDWLGRMLRM